LPDAIGIGLAPQSAAKAASLWKRSMFLAGGDQQLAGVSGRDAEQSCRSWSRGRDERRQLPVELGDLVVQERDAACEAAQSELRRVGRLAEPVSVRAQLPAERGFAFERAPDRKPLAQLAGGCADQVAELHDRRRAGLHSAVTRDP
jgi:hypothetical protein